MTKKKHGRGPTETPGNNILTEIVSLQEHAQMENVEDEPFKITSIVTVPDLFWRGYRNPGMSRQYIVTLNRAIEQKTFREIVRSAFGIKRET